MRHDRSQTAIMDATVAEYYQILDENLRGIRGMNIARWQLMKQTAISILVAWFALEAGADPTFTVGVIAVINGLSIADLAAIWGQTPSNKSTQTERRTQLPDKDEPGTGQEKEKNRR